MFFQPSLELIKAVSRSLLIDFSFMTHQALFTALRVRENTSLTEKTQNYVGGVSTNYSPCFSFIVSQISRMTCPLTSDRQFSSPRFHPCCLNSCLNSPCCLNKGMLTKTSVIEYQILDLQCWEFVFRTHREAQSGTMGSFHSISWVLWTSWHSQSVCGNVKN